MSDTMKKRGNATDATPPKAPDDIVSLLEDCKTKIAKIKILEDELEKNPNASDIELKRSNLSALNLEAAGLLQKIITMATGNPKCHSELIKAFNDENALEVVKERLKRRFAQAQKYGSRVKTEIPKTSLDDIAGQEDVKKTVRSFVFLCQNAELFEKYKLKGGLGMMMYGAPGTGKTMFAEAIAHEMKMPLFVITPADIFKSYVGASEQAVRQIFQDIASFPEGAILFVDECESIFSKRSNDTKDYKAAVTSELLQRMNGEGVDGSRRIMIAATNRPWDIDPAYLRYKRFSHLVHITPPDDSAIEVIVRNKLKGIPLADGVCEYAIQVICSQRGGRYSAADVCGIIEEACRIAVENCMQNYADSHTLAPVTKDMIDSAVGRRKPSIKAEDLELYNNFSPDSMF